MQNKLVQLERAHQNRNPLRRNGDWERNRGPLNNQNQNQNQRVHVPLNPNDVVEHEALPWCRTCQDSREVMHVQ